ncbi:hypothetical protein N0V82_006694 [Gnomoniopsis sp. IMI 355080]|nr:hypothetical protein N0V82_006694 [Gnomoniopsis sp. IMI 355080]
MGHFTDRAGRKRLYVVELAVVIVATFGFIQASDGLMVQWSNGPLHSMDIYFWLTWWRSLLGFGIGAEQSCMQSVARLLVDGLSLGVIEARWNLRNDSGSEMSKLVVDQVWRWTVGVGIIPAAIAIIMRLTIPETPRYYAGIMKDLRKAVKNTLMVYHKKITEKVSKPAQITVQERQNSADDGDAYCILLAVLGAPHIVTAKLNQSHLVAEVVYAILSFVFNLGPNTLIFIMAVEIFPTVYRGTFFEIAAAMGKVGAMVIRVIVAHAVNREASLGIRLIVLISLMLASAVLSWYLPEVQMPTKSSLQEFLDEEQQENSDGSTTSSKGASNGPDQQE